MPVTQENRLISITTPLGEDALLLESIRGSEGISILFSFELSLLSEFHDIAFEEIVGKNATITIDLADGEQRFFNGIISDFTQTRAATDTGQDTRFSHYTATLVPTVWLLTQTAGLRIFQELSVPDIIEKILREKEYTDYALRLGDTYESKTYCVQYRETDFNFISRLMEDEGIYYYFEHSDGNHTLVLADTPGEHLPCPHQETVRYQLTAGGLLEEDVIQAVELKKEIRAGKYTLNDYNFEMPATNLMVEAEARLKLGPGEREIYDYPAEYAQRAAGDRLVNIRMQEAESRIFTITGTSDCRVFTSGYKFKLADFYREDMNDKYYVLCTVDHEAIQTGYTSESVTPGAGAEPAYNNTFTCIPHDIPFRPPRIAPKPIVEGVHTATVVGPPGEEIYTDEHGRVKVQFHWDREGNRDDKSSCWIRVSQLWAGAAWGAMFIPRIGQEVIVDFIEGDPDRPVITGRLYHGNNRPPYGLPGEKTRTTIMSNSSLGGGGANELRFEDKKGEEEVYIHAQKDENTVVENDQGIAVGNDRVETIGRDRTLEVGRDKSEKVVKNKTIQVMGSHNEMVTQGMTITVGSTLTETIGINYAETVGGAMELSVGGALAMSIGAAVTENVAGTKSEAVGGTKSENIGSNKALMVGKNLEETIGQDRNVKVKKNLKASVGGKQEVAVTKEYILNAKKIQLVGNDQINIKTGKAEIIMKKNGDITIKGKKLTIKGSGDVIIKGSKIKEN